MTVSPDRLYDLLPAVYRMRDADQGTPLRALLQVIAEQVEVVDADIDRLYDNWFIETCDDWVVPYIGDLIGYRPVHEAGEPGSVATPPGRARNKILIPRRDVANTLRDRRRKGTPGLLESLARDVAGWPALAVEFYRLLAVTQSLNHLRLHRGGTVDLRDGDALDRLDGPFDELAHTVDVRRIVSHRRIGLYNIPSVGLFVWRLRAYPVTHTPAYCFDEQGSNCYLFSVLGNDAPLFTRPRAEAPHPPRELDLPTPIRRRPFERRRHDYYGAANSVAIWVGSPRHPVPTEHIVAADLSDWTYRPHHEHEIAVDPVLGRLVFPPGQPRHRVWVSYHYGFSADIGGGEYRRPLAQPADARLYRVSKRGDAPFGSLHEALRQWRRDKRPTAVVEIADSEVYVERLRIALPGGCTLQIRAADGARPVIRQLDWETSSADSVRVRGGTNTWLVLDGLMITGRGVQVEGRVRGVTIRHCTLVPGWGLHCDCEPKRPTEPSLMLVGSPACLTIEHSIVGAIKVARNEAKQEPLAIRISDSILDATRRDRIALGAREGLCADAVLTIARTTVLGEIHTHAIELGENTIFAGLVKVARRGHGCLRFCYVPPGSRTPRRHHCQPDLVESAVTARFAAGGMSDDERDRQQESERSRVEPIFNSTRYGTPEYGQLATACSEEITRGADDESEMGAFHDLYQPQRAANLRARLDEYLPAGMDAGILYAT